MTFTAKRNKRSLPLIALAMLVFVLSSRSAATQDYFMPGSRTVIVSHNCYPYNGRWGDRIDRALQTGTPIGIEQDVSWYVDSATGAGRSVLSHDPHPSGAEPTLESYFFAKVEPLLREEMKHPHPKRWPLISLNLDFKTTELDHMRAVRDILVRHQEWLTTVTKTEQISDVMPLHKGPVIVFVGPMQTAEQAFYEDAPVGSPLLAFGAVQPLSDDPKTPAENVAAAHEDNYHRWWNNSWKVVERGGPSEAGAWTAGAEARLRSLIEYAHRQHLWIRFYTLDGESLDDQVKNGFFANYNFGSLQAVEQRLAALYRYHADWVATDQPAMAKAASLGHLPEEPHVQ